MNFTFGIVTTNNFNHPLIQTVLASIEAQNIPDEKYEVIIVGGDVEYKGKLLTTIPFDETKKKAWITRKKNIITEQAKFENIVYMHDYIALEPNWYKNFVDLFGNGFDLCMTPILNADGSRFRDWVLWPDDMTHIFGPWNRHYLLPYNESRFTKHMYFSGAYWIAKKAVMEKFPLDEALSWGEAEDVKWSKQVREHYKFQLNAWSHVKLLKQKDPVFDDITPEMITLLKKHDGI